MDYEVEGGMRRAKQEHKGLSSCVTVTVMTGTGGRCCGVLPSFGASLHCRVTGGRSVGNGTSTVQ
jgi:hypothetical protein